MTVPRQRPHRSKQNYRTPPEFLAATRRLLDIRQFEIDLAADQTNTVAPAFYDVEIDALGMLWGSGSPEWSWCNPPYTDISPWVAKAWQERQVGNQMALLLPASVGANWWRDWVHEKALVLFLNGRLAFMPDKPKWLYPKDCALLLYAESMAPGYDVWSWRA